MDSLAFRLANALLGNPSHAAGLEITLSGPKLKFHHDTVVALTGAPFTADVDGIPLPLYTAVSVSAGATLTIHAVQGSRGARCYLAVGGGIHSPLYLGSRSTFPGGKLGGIQGRALKAGDLLPLGTPLAESRIGLSLPQEWVPQYPAPGEPWQIGVLPGPNGAPDYFTRDDVDTLYTSLYSVHYNSNRLGIRLDGPRPKFARTDGGEGGSHPSNVHDHVYAIGTINFTGDMPIVLELDGPSLGGFVCPATIPSSQLWKMGQVNAKDTINFQPMTLEESYEACIKNEEKIRLLEGAALGETDPAKLHTMWLSFQPRIPEMPQTSAVLATIPASHHHPGAMYRLAGDRYVFVEYGPMQLDLNLRVRVFYLEQALAAQGIDGLVETSPGVRSCMVEYDQLRLPLNKLLDTLIKIEKSLPAAEEQVLKSRVLHLPMAFDDKWTQGAIDKYMKSVRSEAPYLPSNIDFIALNNGLEGGREAVREVVFSASYMVMGLGDVYLGAPCAVPVDPRHRLVVPKYNPARTFTEEGTVGIGGCYMCIYPMDSPGGYQLVGRTLPIWNTYGRAGPFTPATPWLLRIFDQVRFYPVTEDELPALRRDFATGRLDIRIEETDFSMKEYNDMVASLVKEVGGLKVRQKAASAHQNQLEQESLARLAEKEAALTVEGTKGLGAVVEEGLEVTCTFTANVWEVAVAAGDVVAKGQTLLVLEAMKMEFPVTAPADGKVLAVLVEPSALAHQGDVLVVLEPAT
eukprot:jgi/Botrbrau1/17468/Bobra.0054s0055.1